MPATARRSEKLIDQPLMTNVLADLALECEAATVLTMRLARAYDESDEVAQVFRRVVTPAAKFWICKRTPYLAYEAMEVLGGSGYIEESIMPRLYREAPVNSIWEGSGNVMCLDVLRAIERTPNAGNVLRQEFADSGDARLKAFAERLTGHMAAADRNDESQARVLTRDLVLALQAALLLKHAPAAVADAFCASRLDGAASSVFGALPRGLDLVRSPNALCRIKASKNRQRQGHLRHRADAEGRVRGHLDAERIDNDDAQAVPKTAQAIAVLSIDCPLSRIHQVANTRFSTALVGEIERCAQATAAIVARGIVHRAHQAADFDAVERVRHPHQTGQDDRRRHISSRSSPSPLFECQRAGASASIPVAHFDIGPARPRWL